MIRLVTQFDDVRVRATAATPTCAACCSCCCCCVATSLMTGPLTKMSFGRLMANQPQPPVEDGSGFLKTLAVVGATIAVLIVAGPLVPILLIAGWILVLSSPHRPLAISSGWLKPAIGMQVIITILCLEIPLATMLGMGVFFDTPVVGFVGLLVYIVLMVGISMVIRRRA